MELIEVFDIFSAEDCVGVAMVSLIKVANKSISWLYNIYYPKTKNLLRIEGKC